VNSSVREPRDSGNPFGIALVAPSMPPTTCMYRFGSFTFHPETGELFKDGRAVPLRPQPARVLAYLLEREGTLVTRAELVRHVWGDGLTVAFDDGLNFCVRQIRESLGESASQARFLETLPRRDYRFIGPVSRSSLTADRAGVPLPRRWRLATLPVAVVLLLVLTFMGHVDERGEDGRGGACSFRCHPWSATPTFWCTSRWTPSRRISQGATAHGGRSFTRRPEQFLATSQRVLSFRSGCRRPSLASLAGMGAADVLSAEEGSDMTWKRGIGIALVVVVAGAGVIGAEVLPLWWATRAPEEEADRLAALVALQQGDVVAEIGAGRGAMALRMAGHVGIDGTVYATELGEASVRALMDTVAASGRGNVEVRAAAESATGLPDACCALIYMRLVYHHFVEPVTLARDIRRALAPGGRLVVIDFDSRPGLLSWFEPAGRGGHGISLDTVVREVTSAGLQVERTDPRWTIRTHLAQFVLPRVLP
jgi:DNA-binding winged helix-turn-helix (wHTH) protein/ubiquinone/menaquinone biosynthesis C-methylase UbiE